MKLASVLRLILPKASEDEVIKNVMKIMRKAIAFKIAMSRDLGYRCYWINSGTAFDEETMTCYDEEDEGSVHLCIFPGLARTVKARSGGRQKFNTVKSNVVLQTIIEQEKVLHSGSVNSQIVL